jgi:hypothetical protein
MLRLILRLLGISDFEQCKSCEILKQQLAFVNDEKRQLTETLLKIVSPKVYEAVPQELNPVIQTSGLFSRRRAALEAKDREEAKILSEGKHLGKSDDKLKEIENLEKELGVQEGEGA